jgi:hypothetical protein
MNDLASAPTISDMGSDSTSLDPGASSVPAGGGGAPRTLGEPSLRDSIAAAVQETTIEDKPADPEADKAKADAKAAKDAEKPADDKKPAEAKDAAKPAERAADGKFAAKQAEGDPPSAKEAESGASEQNADAKPAESAQAKTTGHIEPPSKFLPDAKEKWTNVPRPVQRDVENMAREHEAEVTRYREAADRYEPIRQFDEIARQHGRAGAHESLAELAQLEDMLKGNPLAALNQILLRAGPRKADGQPVSLFEVAQTIVQMGQQGYQRAVAQQPQQAANSNPDPRIEHLEQRLAQAEERNVAQTVIEPFKAQHPRYQELQGDIALFLKSGKIPGSLSPSDRLAAAYDMAERINPPSSVRAPVAADPDPAGRADDTFSGSTSIKSTPGAVTPIDEPVRGGSIREELVRQVRRQRLG